jgi:hypothetical protein
VSKDFTKFLAKFLIEDMCVLQRDLESISNDRPSSKCRQQRTTGLSVVAVEEVDCKAETEKEDIAGAEKGHCGSGGKKRKLA